jgi:hypothetical protein
MRRANETSMPKQTRQPKKTPQVLRGALPPPEKILDFARECGFVERLRKLHPALLLYTLIFGLSAHQHPTVSEIHRQYTSIDNSRDEEDKIRQQSISNRIDEDMVKFLKLILLSCIDRIASQCSTRLNIRYQTFRTIFILDSTIIRIHAKLAALYQATRTRNGSGGLKISILYNAVAHGLDTISIVPERMHDIKAFKIGPWIKDALILSLTRGADPPG